MEDDKINEVFKVFYYTVNPMINFANKTNRKATKNLISKFGVQRIIKIAEYACEIQGRDFAPVITTPYQLKVKYAQLIIYKNKHYKKPEKNVEDKSVWLGSAQINI